MAFYDFLPGPLSTDNTEAPNLYPRIVSSGTIGIHQLATDIAEASSFTPGDLEGIFVELRNKIAYYLGEGYNVNLEGIGNFSVGLKARREVKDKKEINSRSVYFDKVHFRTSPRFRRLINRRASLTRASGYIGFQFSSNTDEAERRQKLEAYLDKHAFITRTDYSSITGLLKTKALEDLNRFEKEGLIKRKGRGSHVVFVKTGERISSTTIS
ncbi:hypothetical protein EZS27_016319 [termite gut metagenome]|uniref:HU domain-containing protein n=1 Tax=termite gut metagenome TaxID=433724 RepID=A0A5J4RQS9_9ZZZZ